MSHEVKIHEIQTSILRGLLFTRQASYSELRRQTNIESDHFKFHIGRLCDIGYIAKDSSGKYTLTLIGKEYANKLDTDRNIIERQPKSAVIIMLKHGSQVLVQERQKHPYFGFYGYPGGKIRWGETILQAAARELAEETGLTAALAYRGVYHEHVESAEDGAILEDKIFHIVSGSNPTGTLTTTFEGGRNQWMGLEDLAKIKKKYLSCDIETQIGLGELSFVEATQKYTKDEF